MLLVVKDIPITGRKYEFDVAERELKLDMPLLAPAHFCGTAYRSGNDVRIKGEFTTKVKVSCHRCLEDFGFAVYAEFDLFYQPWPAGEQDEQIQLSMEELGILYYREETIDLSFALHDTVILELPMKLLCREECKGLCQHCGNSLNRSLCNCQKKEKKNNPFKEFFEKNQR